jgi:hypothetical protein
MLLSLLKTRFALTEDAAVTGLSHSPLNEKTTELFITTSLTPPFLWHDYISTQTEMALLATSTNPPLTVI